MPMSELRDLYLHTLKDLYSAEKQITKAMPKMIKATEDEQLRSAFEFHLEQTEGQIERLEQIFEDLDEKIRAPKCKGMEGIIDENSEILKEDAESEVLHAALIAGAQKVEHYEIATYGTARTYAQMLGESEAARLLEQSLREEEQTDKKLTQLAMNLNREAQRGARSGMQEGRSAGRSRGNAKGGSRSRGKSGSRRSGRTARA